MKVVITGASKGIGFEVAKKLVGDGHSVLALARNESDLIKMRVECGRFKDNVAIMPFDLINSDYNKLLEKVVEFLGNVDVLINNAGLLVNKPFEQITDMELEAVYKTNIFGPFRLIQALLPIMESNEKSHILNISSMGGFQGASKFSGLSAYSSSKGALSTLTECLAEEFKDRNIAVNALCLGAVQTEMLSKAFPDYKAPTTAKEMAEYVADFALNGHRFYNGKILPVSISTP